MDLSKLSTRQLVNNINCIASAALTGFESFSMDQLCDASHDELAKRQQERGEHVRISNLKKTDFGKAYVCAIEVDGIITGSYYQTDLKLAKTYRSIK